MSQAAEPASARPRWRFTFRLSTLFVVITVVAVACAWPRIYRQYQFWRFKSYIGKDIRQLPESEREAFENLVASLSPQKRGPVDLGQLQSWVVWKLNTDNGIRFVLVQSETYRVVPSGSNLHVSMLNSAGDLVRRTSVPTGWRRNPFEARIVLNELPGENLMFVRVANVLWGEGGPDQFYAFLNDKPVLVRLEHDNAFLANDYTHPNITLGSEQERRTESELIRALSSKREAEILQALVWMSGAHDESPQQRPANLYLEELDQALLHQSICRSATTKTTVQALAKHRHPWVAEAAKHVLQKMSQEGSDNRR
jgi:hypothetical protein